MLASTLNGLAVLIQPMGLAERIREAMGKMTAAELARAAKVTPASVTFWLDGSTKSLKAEKAALIEQATGYRASWIVTGRGPKKTDHQPAQEETPDYFPEPHQPTLEEAVYRLAELLAALDDDGRAQASQTLSTLAKGPERGAARAAELLLTLERLHPREPQPDPTPPNPTKAGETAAAERAGSKARLTVKTGGGKKVQLALPFPAKTAPDPWNTKHAPPREREWYAELKTIPKVKES